MPIIIIIIIIIIQEIVHEVHIIYIYSKTRHMNIKRCYNEIKVKNKV